MKVVAEDVPIVVKKAAEKAVKEAAEYEKSKVSKSTFSQRITPFLWGFVLTSFAGIYFLNRDLQESNMHLQEAINAMKNDKEMELVQMKERLDRRELAVLKRL